MIEICRTAQVEGRISIHRLCDSLLSMESFLSSSNEKPFSLYWAPVSDSLTKYTLHHLFFKKETNSIEIEALGCPLYKQHPEKAVISLDAKFGVVHKRRQGCCVAIEQKRYPRLEDPSPSTAQSPSTALLEHDEVVYKFVYSYLTITLRLLTLSSRHCNIIQEQDKKAGH